MWWTLGPTSSHVKCLCKRSQILIPAYVPLLFLLTRYLIDKICRDARHIPSSIKTISCITTSEVSLLLCYKKEVVLSKCLKQYVLENSPRYAVTLTLERSTFQQCISAPGSGVSLIQVDAYKKLVLLQLLTHGKVSMRTLCHILGKAELFSVKARSNPKYTSSSASTAFKNSCGAYIDYATAYASHNLQSIEAAVERHGEVFERVRFSLPPSDTQLILWLAGLQSGSNSAVYLCIP